MEDLLKHAFDTTLVGLFALLCYGGAALVCAPRLRERLRTLDPDKMLARIGVVVLPVAYVVGSISFALGDDLFNKPPLLVATVATIARPFGLRIEADGAIRDSAYDTLRGVACGTPVPGAAGDGVWQAQDWVCSPGLDPDSAIKPLYAFSKYSLQLNEPAAAELRDTHEHLVILRGTAYHGTVLFFLGLVGAVAVGCWALGVRMGVLGVSGSLIAAITPVDTTSEPRRDAPPMILFVGGASANGTRPSTPPAEVAK